MATDIVELGGGSRLEAGPDTPRARKLNIALLLQLAAGAAAIGSVVGRWQVAIIKPNREGISFSNSEATIAYDLGTTGFGTVYLFALLTVTICTVIVTGTSASPLRDLARRAGLTAAAFAAATVAVQVYNFGQFPFAMIGYPISSPDMPDFTVKTEWGLYAAVAAIALASAALFIRPASAIRAGSVPAVTAPAEEQERVNGFTVTMEPAAAPAAPSHELYMRP